jgi:hypothetical protein
MFKRPILIYSDFCIHSKTFIETIQKQPDMFNQFIRVNIDVDPSTKRRPDVFFQIQRELSNLTGTQVKITRVPTVITPNAEYIISDKDAFKWLEYQLNKMVKQEINGFNNNEMNSFSDNYSNFGSTHINDAKEQNFKFFQNGKLNDDNYTNAKNVQLKKGEFINGFLNDSDSKSNQIDMSQKQMEREQLDASFQRGGRNNTGSTSRQFEQFSQTAKLSNQELNEKINTRQQFNTEKAQTRPSIDWTSPDFGLSGELSGELSGKLNGRNDSKNSQSDKEQIINKRLEQLMNDRKQF